MHGVRALQLVRGAVGEAHVLDLALLDERLDNLVDRDVEFAGHSWFWPHADTLPKVYHKHEAVT